MTNMLCHITDEVLMKEPDERRTTLDDYRDGQSDQDWLLDLTEAIACECYVSGSRREMSPTHQAVAERCRALRKLFSVDDDAEVGKRIREWLDEYQKQIVEDMR